MVSNSNNAADDNSGLTCPKCKKALAARVKFCPFCGAPEVEKPVVKKRSCTIGIYKCHSARELAMALGKSWTEALVRIAKSGDIERLLEDNLEDAAAAKRYLDSLRRSASLDAPTRLSLALMAIDPEGLPWVNGTRRNRDGILDLAKTAVSSNEAWPPILTRENGRALADISHAGWLKLLYGNWQRAYGGAQRHNEICRTQLTSQNVDLESPALLLAANSDEVQASLRSSVPNALNAAAHRGAHWRRVIDAGVPTDIGALWLLDRYLQDDTVKPREEPEKPVAPKDDQPVVTGDSTKSDVIAPRDQTAFLGAWARDPKNKKVVRFLLAAAAVVLLLLVGPKLFGTSKTPEATPVPADVVARMEELHNTAMRAADSGNCESAASTRQDMERLISDNDLNASKFDAYRSQVDSLNALVQQVDTASQNCVAQRNRDDAQKASLAKFEESYRKAGPIYQEGHNYAETKDCTAAAKSLETLKGLVAEASDASSGNDKAADHLTQLKQWQTDLSNEVASCSDVQSPPSPIPSKPDKVTPDRGTRTTTDSWEQAKSATAVDRLIRAASAAKERGDCDMARACLADARMGLRERNINQTQREFFFNAINAVEGMACTRPTTRWGGFTRSIPRRTRVPCDPSAATQRPQENDTNSSPAPRSAQDVINDWTRRGQ